MTPDQQYGAPPVWHALHQLPSSAKSVLDVGCNVGEALLHAHKLGVERLFGIDINPRAVTVARSRLGHLPGSQVFQGCADSLPLPDRSIDAALCCDVLEHIPEELRPEVVREVHRVLEDHGHWVITVPASGLFAGLDPANLRLTFPRLFQLATWLTGGTGRESGYLDQKHGIVWHKHFSLRELRALLAPRFRVERVRFRGMLLVPLCTWLEFPFHRKGAHQHLVVRALTRLKNWEMSLRPPEFLAYDLLLVARKNPV